MNVIKFNHILSKLSHRFVRQTKQNNGHYLVKKLSRNTFGMIGPLR